MNFLEALRSGKWIRRRGWQLALKWIACGDGTGGRFEVRCAGDQWAACNDGITTNRSVLGHESLLAEDWIIVGDDADVDGEADFGEGVTLTQIVDARFNGNN